MKPVLVKVLGISGSAMSSVWVMKGVSLTVWTVLVEPVVHTLRMLESDANHVRITTEDCWLLVAKGKLTHALTGVVEARNQAVFKLYTPPGKPEG